jgi:ABC-type uncharacterized transport system ATPase subunit
MDAMMDVMKSETILQITGLKVAYGGIKAVKGIDLQVARGELVTLIGANGAGKTTTLSRSAWSSKSWPWYRKGGACSPACRFTKTC